MQFPTQGIVFDLDDTLYLERDYVRSGFDAVGRYLAERHDIGDFSARAWALFEEGRRNTVFDELLGQLAPQTAVTVPELVSVYRDHTPEIALCPDAERFLQALPPGMPRGMITDGPVASQSAKIRALSIDAIIPHIIMSDSYGIAFRKPHSRPFASIEQMLDLPGTELTYIADNPLKDFVTPRQRGWRTIRIQRPLGEHQHRPMEGDHAADMVIESFDDLRA